VVQAVLADSAFRVMSARMVQQAVDASPLTPDHHADYSAYLLSNPNSLIYYSLKYKAFLEDLLGCTSAYWLAREDGRITGVLPTMRYAGRYGDVLNSLPYYGSNGGILASTSAAEAALVRTYDEFSRSPGVAAATWVSNPFALTANAPAHDLIDERIAQFTPLVDDAERLLQQIDGSARRNVNKARSEGVSVRVDNRAFEFLEQSHHEGMAVIGGLAKTPEFFRKLPRHFCADKDYRVYVAERAGRPCAALLLLYFNRTIEYYVPTTIEAERNSQPMALILYQAMLDGAAAGYTRWNWGATWPNQIGVWRFKHKWGAIDSQYKYYVKLNRPDLLQRTRSELLNSYPGFYVVPFSALAAA